MNLHRPTVGAGQQPAFAGDGSHAVDRPTVLPPPGRPDQITQSKGLHSLTIQLNLNRF